MSVTPKEVVFLIDDSGAVYHRDDGDGPTHIPDARSRWEVIWESRDRLREIAHSHPVGPLAFSNEDETTMSALESALGRAVIFSVVAPGGMLRRENGRTTRVEIEPAWAAELRAVSGMSSIL